MPSEFPGAAGEAGAGPESGVDVLSQLAEAEAAEAQARAEAERAAARAEQLRSDAGAPLTSVAPASVVRRIAPKLGAALAGLTLSVLMLRQHASADAHRAHDDQIVEGARAGVVALLSIDHSQARADVQRVLDRSTGTFRDDFAKTADDFVATAEAQKVVTVAKVKAVALESADRDGGVVLVAVNSEVTNAAGAEQDSRPFRMSVTVARDGAQFKMSSLEFVP
jgi:Mce-associated membrane protein